ncbi:thioredoxin domain-containing protein [Microbacterium kribbense]|uniref:Thioredoxin domain-containing protein n=1 Tax=Microbacterium kribbense TaxID=433645 RepID=A0ABP7GIM0_9MICO
MASRLADSASPYLRAHAGNPVAWYPWGTEAFAEAARRDVPVFISIGYSTCHWCHVMARESFEDAATAAVLNAGFVAIKVDREEHPEVDEAYLAAASAFTRNLGWPLSVFATPGGHAFYAGTYFPSEPRQGMTSFRQVLAAVTEAWTARRDQVEQTAQSVVAALAAVREATTAADALPTAEDLGRTAELVLEREDRQYGGFAPAGAGMTTPKFPMVPVLRFLQSPAFADHVPDVTAAALRALRAMAASPLHDDVDGGFFRYATRRDWTIPHYERMLTDNAGLLEVALDAGEHAIARGIAAFLIDVLQQPSGGFASAQDSESLIDGARSEGGYYAQDAAGRGGLQPPAIDGKIVTGWNGMAIGALARAGARLGETAFIDAARRAADAVLEVNVAPGGRLHRASLDEIISPALATLEDHGLLASGLVALAAATGEIAYAQTARDLVDACLLQGPRPAAPGGGDPVLAAQGVASAPAVSDGDHPSGPAAVADAAYALWLIGAGGRYRDAAASVVRTHAARALAEPTAHGALLRVAAALTGAPRQLVVVGGTAADPLTRAAGGQAADVFATVTAAQARQLAGAGFTLFEGKTGDIATAYDCRDFACRLPTTDPAVFGS